MEKYRHIGNAKLATMVQLDSRGRITIPEVIRKRAKMTEAQEMHLSYGEAGELWMISLTKPEPEATIRKTAEMRAK